jgi:hypothetical protein
VKGLPDKCSQNGLKQSSKERSRFWVVSRYLDRYCYQSDYTKSSAWNLALQALTDLADLEIKEDDISLGIVECIPMSADAETLEIPEQAVMSDRIAYIAVEN